MSDLDSDNVQLRSSALEWLEEMQHCVRTVDFVRCRNIFAADAVGFGTKATLVVGLEAIERDQWRQVWGRIRNFTFQIELLHFGGVGGSELWLACPWISEGRDPDGNWLTRPGRITAVLERRNRQWLAVHTHHSLAPGDAAPLTSVE